MTKLIPIIDTNGVKAVDARLLHQAMEVKTKDFSMWITRRIEKYGFVENIDYELSHKNVDNSTGRPTNEYTLSLDMAKELAMVENNARAAPIKERPFKIGCPQPSDNWSEGTAFTILRAVHAFRVIAARISWPADLSIVKRLGETVYKNQNL